MESTVRKVPCIYPLLFHARSLINSIITAYFITGIVISSLGQVSGYAGGGIMVPIGTLPSDDFSSNYGESSNGVIGKIGVDAFIIDQKIGLALLAMYGFNSNHYHYSHIDLEDNVWLRHYGIFGGLLLALNRKHLKIHIMPGYGKTTSSELKSWLYGSVLLPKASAGSFGFDIGASYEFNIVDNIGFFFGLDVFHWKATFDKLENNILGIDVKGPASLLALTAGIVF